MKRREEKRREEKRREEKRREEKRREEVSTCQQKRFGNLRSVPHEP